MATHTSILAWNTTRETHSCLENPIDRGVWWATVLGVARVKHDLAAKQQGNRKIIHRSILHKWVVPGIHLTYSPVKLWVTKYVEVREYGRWRVIEISVLDCFLLDAGKHFVGLVSLPYLLLSFAFQGASLSSAGRIPFAPSILPCTTSWRRWWLAVVPSGGPLLTWKSSFLTCQSSSASLFRLARRSQTSMRRCTLSAHRSSSMLKSLLAFWTPSSRNTAPGQCRWGGRDGMWQPCNSMQSHGITVKEKWLYYILYMLISQQVYIKQGFPGGSVVKNLPASAGGTSYL